ncbi:MAG: Gfo/Idh/MocA family oxidoreductase [Kiritimatiellae bacterium]|nr:Gfo/Idh/MocA family oxidoreductase [Kiritimatiellia bacterium]
MAQDLGIGLVGLGWAAGAHIEAFKAVEGANVVALCSRRRHDAAALEKQYGIPVKPYADYAEMLADPAVQAVDICTLPSLHAPMAIQAVEAGKHLVLEKPMALSYEKLKELRAAVKKVGVMTCVCFECRYSAHFQMIRSIIDQGLLGELHYGEVDYYHGIGPWYGQYKWNVSAENGGSSLLSAGCHAMDGMRFFMDGEIEEVTQYGARSQSASFAEYAYDATSVTILKFKGGKKTAKVASSIDCLQPYYFHIHLIGSEGSLLDNKIYSAKLKGMTKARWSTLETALIDSGDVSDHPYQPQFQAFVDSVKTGKPMPLTDFDTAFETHRVVFAADRSGAEGRPVKLAELE